MESPPGDEKVRPDKQGKQSRAGKMNTIKRFIITGFSSKTMNFYLLLPHGKLPAG